MYTNTNNIAPELTAETSQMHGGHELFQSSDEDSMMRKRSSTVHDTAQTDRGGVEEKSRRRW